MTNAPAHRCGNCLQEGLVSTTMPYTENMPYEGKSYAVSIANMPAVKCPNCGEISVGPDGLAAMDSALRAKVRLLEPSAITHYRERLGLRKKGLAELIRISAEGLGKLEKGDRNQSTLMDWALRMFCASAEVRRLSERFLKGDDLVNEMENSTRSEEIDRIYQATSLIGFTTSNKYMASRDSWIDIHGPTLVAENQYPQAA